MGERKSDILPPSIHSESRKYRAASTVRELFSWPKIRLNRKFAHLALVMSIGLAAVGIARADEKAETLPQTGPVPTLVENGPATDSPVQQSNEGELADVELEATPEKLVTRYYLKPGSTEESGEYSSILVMKKDGVETPMVKMNGAERVDYDIVRLSPTQLRMLLTCSNEGTSKDNTIVGLDGEREVLLGHCSDIMSTGNSLIIVDVFTENGSTHFKSLEILSPQLSIESPRVAADGTVWFLNDVQYNDEWDGNGLNDSDDDGNPDYADKYINGAMALSSFQPSSIDYAMEKVPLDGVITANSTIDAGRGSYYLSQLESDIISPVTEQVFFNRRVFDNVELPNDESGDIILDGVSDPSGADVQSLYIDGNTPVPIRYGLEFDEGRWLKEYAKQHGISQVDDFATLPSNKYWVIRPQEHTNEQGEEMNWPPRMTQREIILVEDNPEANPITPKPNANKPAQPVPPESVTTPEQATRVTTKYYLEQKENGTAFPDVFVIQEINGSKDQVIKLPMARDVGFSVYKTDTETLIAVNCQNAPAIDLPTNARFTNDFIELECSATPQTAIIRFDISGNREVIILDTALGNPTFDSATGDLYLTAENIYHNSATGDNVKDPFHTNVYIISKEQIGEQFASLNNNKVRTIRETSSTSPIQLDALEMTVATTLTNPNISQHVTFDATTGQFTFPANGGDYPDFVGELTVIDGVPGFIPSAEINDQFWQKKAEEAKAAEQKLLDQNNGIMPVGEFTSVQSIGNVGAGNDPEVFVNVVEAAG